MAFSKIFEKQTERDHVLQSLLIALSFTPQVNAVHIQSILAGFVKDANNYISAQKSRGWLEGQEKEVLLSDKSQRLVRLSQFKISQTKPEISRQTYHDLLLVRTLFLCLVHLRFEEIMEIRKQRYYDNKFIPDLTIVTQTRTLLIEIDRGKQPFSTLESKVTGLQDAQDSTQAFVIIYFTDSQKTYDYFNQNFDKTQVQCVYLQSQTLAQDILDLRATTQANSQVNSRLNPYVETTVEVESELGFEDNFEADFTPEGINLNPEGEANTYSTPQEETPTQTHAYTQTFNSQTHQRAHAQATFSQAKFQPVQLTNPITGKPIKKATIQLAPNVFVYDASLVEKASKPWSEEYTAALKNLKSQHLDTNPNLSNNYQDIITDTLRMLEINGLAQFDDDFEPEDKN